MDPMIESQEIDTVAPAEPVYNKAADSRKGPFGWHLMLNFISGPGIYFFQFRRELDAFVKDLASDIKIVAVLRGRQHHFRVQRRLV